MFTDIHYRTSCFSFVKSVNESQLNLMEIYCFLHILPYKQTVTFIRLRYLSSPVIIVYHVHDVNALSAMRNKGKTQMIYGKRIT